MLEIFKINRSIEKYNDLTNEEKALNKRLQEIKKEKENYKTFFDTILKNGSFQNSTHSIIKKLVPYFTVNAADLRKENEELYNKLAKDSSYYRYYVK